MSFTYYGQFNPPVDQYLHEHFFDNYVGGTAIECGAFDGIQESSCYFFEKFLSWRCINVEACPPLFEKLQENRPESINICAALSDQTGIAKFKHAISPLHGIQFGNGSLLHSSGHYNQLIKDNCSFIDFNVPTITYSQLLTRAMIDVLDIFVLDVEGYELQVINSMRLAKLMPRVLCVEHGHLGQQAIIEALEGLPLYYHSSLYINSFFINTLNPPPLCKITG